MSRSFFVSIRPALAPQLLIALLAGCGSSESRDSALYELPDGSTADSATETSPSDADAGFPDSQPAEAQSPDSEAGSACTPSASPVPNSVDTCLLAHRPHDASHLSNSRPAATQPVVVRLETRADDVENVILQAWAGWQRSITMKRVSTLGLVDVYEAEVPASAHPVYYRFEVTDGTATVTLNASGASSSGASESHDFVIAPVPSPRTIHYATGFAAPELRVRSGQTYASIPMVAEGAGWYGATALPSSGDLEFFVGDGQSGPEDRPPGGGDYAIRGDVDEAWLSRGVVTDVPPDLIDVEWLDAHTHPFNRDSNGNIVYDPQPLIQVVPAAGIKRAVCSMPGTLAQQDSAMSALHADNRWIVPIVWVRPKEDSVDEVRSLLQSGRFHGVKLHPVVDAFPADDPSVDPFLDLAAEQHVPVQIHSATDDVGSVARIVTLAKRHADVPVVMVHTELGAVDKSSAIQKILPISNIFAETSWTNPESILQIMGALDSSRTLFGTDATVDGFEHFTKKSTANPQGQYVYAIPEIMAAVKAQANPGAFDNWAHLTSIRLYRIRFRPDPDLYDTDGDGTPDPADDDRDQDGTPDAVDGSPSDPGES